MITEATLDAMLAAGLSAEQIVTILKASLSETQKERDERDERDTRKRELAKARQQRRRAAIASRNDERDVTPARAHVEDKPLTTVQEPQLFVEEITHSKPAKRDAAEFRAEFPDLDADRLDALIKHRKTKRAQLSGHAARLFRKDVEACGLSIAAGVDMAISRNWITIKPEWLDKPVARGSPVNGSNRPLRGVDALAANLRQRITDDEQQGTGGSGNPDPGRPLGISHDRG